MHALLTANSTFEIKKCRCNIISSETITTDLNSFTFVLNDCVNWIKHNRINNISIIFCVCVCKNTLYGTIIILDYNNNKFLNKPHSIQHYLDRISLRWSQEQIKQIKEPGTILHMKYWWLQKCVQLLIEIRVISAHTTTIPHDTGCMHAKLTHV